MRSRWKVVAAMVLLLAVTVAVAVAQRGVETQTFKVKKGGILIVDAEDVHANIQVRVWSRSEVRVKVDGLSQDELGDLEMEERDNTVIVEYFGGGRRWRTRGIDIVAEVPEEFSLDLSTSGGDIEVNNKIIGSITAQTSGGDIDLNHVDGEVDVATSGGDITTRDISGDAEIRTSGGDIDVGNVTGELTVHTSGGDIVVGTIDKDLDAKTAGGDIEVGDVGGFADVSTAGGDVRLGKVSGTADLRTAGGDIELLSATGRVSARTAGGDIVLENVTGSIEAETAGGDIIAELIPSGTRSSNFDTAGGDIELSVPENARVDIFAEIRIHGGGWSRNDDDFADDYDVYSDFDAKKHERHRRGVSAEYVLNGGGAKISLETTNGDIEIRKLRR